MKRKACIDVSHADKQLNGGGRTSAASAASKFGKVIKVSGNGPIGVNAELGLQDTLPLSR